MPATSADISILATGRPVRIPTPDGKIWLANYDRNFRTTTLGALQRRRAALVEVRRPDRMHRQGSVFRSTTVRSRRSRLSHTARKTRGGFVPEWNRIWLPHLW